MKRKPINAANDQRNFERLENLARYLPADLNQVRLRDGEKEADRYAAPHVAQYLRDEGVPVNDANLDDLYKTLYNHLGLENEQWVGAVLAGVSAAANALLPGLFDGGGDSQAELRAELERQRMEAEKARRTLNTVLIIAGVVVAGLIIYFVTRKG